jgi:hypothetical protein
MGCRKESEVWRKGKGRMGEREQKAVKNIEG